MKKVYSVTLKRMHNDKPESWTVDVCANNTNQAILMASRVLRREQGITNCAWTPTHIKSLGHMAAVI